MTTSVLKLALMRAAKTGAQTFGAAIVAAWIASGDQTVTNLVDTIGARSDNAGGVALLAAIGALGWNWAAPTGGDKVITQ